MNGIITLAVRGEQYARYAENLALSAKLRGVPTSVVIGNKIAKRLNRHLFDKVFIVEDPATTEACWEMKLSLDKYDTGYSNTLFIDVDALVMRGLSDVFSCVEQVGFILPSEKIITPGDKWDNKDVYALYELVYGEKCPTIPQINGGFFGWNSKSDVAKNWFSTARSTIETLKTHGHKREELAMLLTCARTKSIIPDPHFVSQMWCCAIEHSMSFSGNGCLIAKMPWWDKPYNSYIAHFGSNYMIEKCYYWTAMRSLGRVTSTSEPYISILVPTFARTEHLQEALASALSQHYTNYEIVVCNDCPRQELSVTPDSHTRIINCPDQFPTLGAKRNFLIDNAHGDIVTFLDDDDLLLPWHLRQIADAFQDYNCDSVRISQALFYSRNNKNITWGGAPICVAVRRTKAPRFSNKMTGEDQDFRAALPNAIELVVDNPAYVYEWGNGTHHVSTISEEQARENFRAEAYGRIDKKKEPEGKYLLVPQLKSDVADWFS